VMEQLSNDASFAGYVDLRGIIELVPADERSDLDADIRAIVDALDALAYASGPAGDGTRSDAIILLAP